MKDTKEASRRTWNMEQPEEQQSSEWLRLRSVQEGGRSKYRLRFVGGFKSYWVHWPTVRKGKTKKDEPFPDSRANPRFSRNCSDDASCPWCKLGYERSPRWVVVVIDRDDKQLKRVELPLVVCKEIGRWYKPRVDQYPGGPGRQGEMIDFGLTVMGTRKDKEYKVKPVGKARPLKKDERKMLTRKKKAGELDLKEPTRPSFMAEELQIQLFGEVIQAAPDEQQCDEVGRLAAELTAHQEEENEEENDDTASSKSDKTPDDEHFDDDIFNNMDDEDDDDDDDFAW